MISLKQRNKGFTIVELLIVIVVIGILALLVITTYGGIQQKARNSQRSDDVKSISTTLEIYFNDNGHYPSRTEMSTASFLTANMKGLDKEALVDPSSTCDPAPSSGTSSCLNATPVAKKYSYAVFASDGTSSCESASDTCAVYKLVATYEGQVNGKSTFEKVNQN